MSKFRPGLTIEELSFIQCVAFQDVWVMLWDIILLLLHQKGLKPEKWDKKMKRSEPKDHWHPFQHVNVTVNDINMSRLQEPVPVFLMFDFCINLSRDS